MTGAQRPMLGDTLDITELARYLQRDARELAKLAEKGDVPGRKVGGEWRFARAEINLWLERRLSGYTEGQLRNIEGQQRASDEPLIASLLCPACVAVPLNAATKASVLRGLVKLAEQSWHVYDPDAVLEAVQAREELASTAQDNGVALVHPRRPLPSALGEPVVAFGRTLSPLPFGGRRGALTDLYFLVLARDDRTHLRILARLARLLLRPDFLDGLRARDTAGECRQWIVESEAELIGAEAE